MHDDKVCLEKEQRISIVSNIVYKVKTNTNMMFLAITGCSEATWCEAFHKLLSVFKLSSIIQNTEKNNNFEKHDQVILQSMIYIITSYITTTENYIHHIYNKYYPPPPYSLSPLSITLLSFTFTIRKEHNSLFIITKTKQDV